MERLLFNHLCGDHKEKEIKDVFAHIRNMHSCKEPLVCEKCNEDHGEMTALAYYMAAV